MRIFYHDCSINYEIMGIPQNDTTKIAKYEVDGYWQYFKNINGEYIDIYAPDEAYETYDISGELREGVNELGGTSKLGFIKVVEGFSGNVCNDSYRAWDIENGRIYEVGGRFYQVRGDSEVGGYFFDRGGHDEFGLPVGNEVDGIYDSYQVFSKVIGGEEIRIVDSIFTSPHQEPEGEKYCRGEEPICGNGIIEEGEVCDDGNTSDNDQCSSDCRNKCEVGKKWDGNRCVGDGEDAVCGNGVVEAGEVCDDGNISDGDWCSADCSIYDEKQKECMEKGMRKYINPNDENDIVCAKINPAPYINQYLDSSGNPGNPRAGRTMCGANTVAMLAAAKGKYDYQGDYDRLKTYTYQDNEIEITGMSRSCDWVNDIAGADMYDVSGVWSYVGYNDHEKNICNMSIAWRMRDYLIALNRYSDEEGYSIKKEKENIYWEFVKESINKDENNIGGFIIQQVQSKNERDQVIFGHIFLVIGYTDDERFIVNDPYTDLINHKGEYTFTGNGAIYSVKELNDRNIHLYYHTVIR